MSTDTIRLGTLLVGMVKGLPDFVQTNRGLLGLITAKADKPGSIGARLEKLAAQQPQAPALRYENRQWSYGEFNAWANRIAATLRAHGVGSGDRVAVLMENRPETLACVAAILKLGAVAGMLNHQQRGEVLAHSIQLTKAKLTVVGDECLEALRSAACGAEDGRPCLWDGEGRAPFGYMDLRAESAGQPETNPPETAQILQKQPSFLIFTSGTTGLPKASVMTHYRWLRGMAGLGQMSLRLKKDDVLYCPLPLYHNNALTVSWGAVLGAGATLALARKFSASRFWDDVRAHGATAFCYIGELCRYLLNQPETARDRDHRVRLAVGNGLRPELWDRFEQRFGIERICEFYGASEGNLVFVNGFGMRRTAGFCPLSYAIVEFDAVEEQPVRDAKGFLRKVAKGGSGLLISEVTDKSPFDGYTDAQASEAKLLRNVFQPGDCWFNTGDLVRDQGYKHIQFVDRVGDTFRWKGENVATTEVEGALARYAGIEQAVVYGVSVPGADGRAGMAALTWRGCALNGAGLAAFLHECLPAYAVPLFLRLREEQEVTSTFKYRKVELKQEGFDTGRVRDPLYVLLDRTRGYEPLTPETHARIASGAVRF